MQTKNNITNPLYMEKIRYNQFDKLKTLCAFFIVCLHATFPNAFGEYFTALIRIAVPIFFMISGYFFDPQTAPRQIRKLIILLLMSNVLYFIWDLLLTILQGDLHIWLSESFNIKSIVAFLLFNESPFGGHLWYLGAILYVIIIYHLIFKSCYEKVRRVFIALSPALLLCDLILGKYSLLIMQKEFSYIYIRNWMFVGIPYFTIGMWLHDHKIKTSCYKLVRLIICFITTTILEHWTLVHYNLNAARDHYISTTFLAIVVFLLFQNHINPERNMISDIGKEKSTWIYIIHPILVLILNNISKSIGAYWVFIYIRPFAVFVVSVVVAKSVLMCSKKIKKKPMRSMEKT